MWIENTTPDDKPVRRLRCEATDGETVEFTENNKANVSQDVGEALTDEFEHFEEASE